MPTTLENSEGKEKDAITIHTSPFPLHDNKIAAVANITNKIRTRGNNNILYTALMYSVLMLRQLSLIPGCIDTYSLCQAGVFFILVDFRVPKALAVGFGTYCPQGRSWDKNE